MKWSPSHWRGDELVRSCEPLSRYVWFEMIGLMHEAEPYGHLVQGGRAMDYDGLSRVIAVDVGDVKRAVKELERRGVLSRTTSGVIYSRRMIRDEEKRKTLRENGALGGNPVLKNQPDSLTLDNQPDIQPVKAKRIKSTESKIEAIASVADGDVARSYHPAFLLAWGAYPHTKGRSSRPRSYGPWRKAAKAVGSATRLHGAIEQFAKLGREPKADCGAKGFHLWLRDALYEDWLTDASGPGEFTAAQRLELYRTSGQWRPDWGDRPDEAAA